MTLWRRSRRAAPGGGVGGEGGRAAAPAVAARGAAPGAASGAAPGAAPVPEPPAARLGPRPSTLSEEDDRLLADIAGLICRRGLATPAVLWLESLRPLSFLGSQALRFCEPFAQPFLPAGQCGRLAEILEVRGHLERLVRHVEAAADAEPSGPLAGAAAGPRAGTQPRASGARPGQGGAA